MEHVFSPRMSKWVATAVLAAMLPVSTACFGSFNLTRQLYQFNREVSNDRWVRWIVFLGMAGLPVYAAGFVIDGLFGNAVEFWGGRSPFAMAPGTTHEVVGTNGERLRMTVASVGVVDVELHDPAGAIHRMQVIEEGDDWVGYGDDGAELSRIPRESADPSLAVVHRPQR